MSAVSTIVQNTGSDSSSPNPSSSIFESCCCSSSSCCSSTSSARSTPMSKLALWAAIRSARFSRGSSCLDKTVYLGRPNLMERAVSMPCMAAASAGMLKSCAWTILSARAMGSKVFCAFVLKKKQKNH